MPKIKSLIISTVLTFLILTLLISVNFDEIRAATNVTFTVNLTISSNTAPDITWVQSGINATPLESSTRAVYIAFNVTDLNGLENIDTSTAQIQVTHPGEASRTGSCSQIANDTSSLIMMFNCTINMQYYDKDGDWIINATISDDSAAKAENSSINFTYGQLQAVTGNLDGISFGDTNLGQSKGATNDPLYLDNTGNQNFTQLNITAYDLVGVQTPTESIEASRFYVNATNDNFGVQLANNTMVVIPDATLPRDIGGTDNNATLYFWVNMPSSGLSQQNYTSSNYWIVQVFP